MDIKTGFNTIAQKYDQQRRLLVPRFDDFYNLPLEVLNYSGTSPAVLDIDCGTGLFSSFILTKYPSAKITMIDFADELINIAKERFALHPEFNYIIADYTKYEFEQQYDIIISALSIHHLSHNAKRELYQKCYFLLNDEGCLINADQVLSPSNYIEEINLKALHEHHKSTELSERDIEMACERMKHDNPSTLFEQFQWLYESKYRYVDCIYKYHQFCVLFAQK